MATDRQRAGRRVALKWIPPDRLATTRRVFRLVEAAASPHLAPLLELLPPSAVSRVFGAASSAVSPGAMNGAGDGAWLVMGWIDGAPLVRGPAAWSVVARQVMGVARALEVLHAVGTHHGDVSPANVVLMQTGAAVLVDFGAMTTHGVGTPGFMAPEVARGGGGPTADTWSLGAVACWCWLGDVPAREITRLGARRDVERRLRVLLDAADHPTTSAERAALRLLAAMLDPDPSARPTMGGVVDALDTWASGDVRDAVASEHVAWTRPPPGATGWPWVGDELERVVDAARRQVRLIEIVGDDDAGATWLADASCASLATLGTDVEVLDAASVDAIVERWLEAPEGRVLLAHATRLPADRVHGRGDALRRSAIVARATLIVTGIDEVDGASTVERTDLASAGPTRSRTAALSASKDGGQRGTARIALRPRSDRELQQLLAVAGLRRRARPWVDALRASSGGLAGRARSVVGTWIDRQAQSPHVRDVALSLAERHAATLSLLDAERVLEVAWGVETTALEARLGVGRIPHDVVLATARHELARHHGASYVPQRAQLAFEAMRSRGAVVTPSLAIDLGLGPRARPDAASLDGDTRRATGLGGRATQAVVEVLLATDEDGVFPAGVRVSAAEAAAFDDLASTCLATAVARGDAAVDLDPVGAGSAGGDLAQTVARAYVALARRYLGVGASERALACCLAAKAAIADPDDDRRAAPSLQVALMLEHARALQRLGRAREAKVVLAASAAWLEDEARWRDADVDALDVGSKSQGGASARALALLRVAALEARVAVDIGEAATLLATGSALREAAAVLLSTEEPRSPQLPHRAGLEWRRATLEYTTWSTLLALHGGDLAAALTGARELRVRADDGGSDGDVGDGRIARALHVAGNVAQVGGHLREAAGLYARAAAAFRARGEDTVAALVLASAAGLAWPTGDVARALDLGRAALRRAMVQVAASREASRLGVWGMLANLAPALAAADPAELAAWVDALDDDRPADGLEGARRAVFRELRGRGTVHAVDESLREPPAREEPLVDAEARLFECGARDEAIAFALDDVALALRRGDHRAALGHLRRALAWAAKVALRDDVAALLAATRVDVFVSCGGIADPASEREGAAAWVGGSLDERGATSFAEERRAVLAALVAAGAPETWVDREQRWVALRLRLSTHRLLRVASQGHATPERRDELLPALHRSERQLATDLEFIMSKTPPPDRPNVLRSLALADDEVEWLEGLAERGAQASSPADVRAAPGSPVSPSPGGGNDLVSRGGHAEGVAQAVASGALDLPLAEAATRPRDDASWRERALAAYRRLAREDDLERVLAQFVDAMMELTDAERGLVVLADEAARLEVARELQGDGAAVHVSRSVVERVLESGEPVLATDAAEDARFGRARSVSHLALRSILAVPLRHRGRVIGAAYVDHRLRRGAFDEASLAGVEAFADLAALAIAHARALSLLRARSEALAAREAELAAALEAREVEVAALRNEAGPGASLQIGSRTLVGGSGVMQRVFRLLRRVSTSNVPVVIGGESGTGKELVARALHELGPRSKAPFIAENCAAIPESLLESALFGHARGSFTGAVQAAPGLFEAAHGGTLFLDEITETSLGMQSKLLRVLQEGEVRRIGETSPRRVDVRIVVATNRDLERLVAEGKFRQDLYYRLSVVRVDVPALRERVEDIPQLIAHFLQVASDPGEGEPALRVSSAAMRRLVRHSWPGNVRELENEVRRWLALVDDVVREDDLSPAILLATGGLPERRELPPGEALVELLADPAFAEASDEEMEGAASEGASPAKLDDAALDLRTHVERVERALVGEALRRTGNNLTQAARLLGLSRFGLQKKLRRRDDGREPTLGGESAAAGRGRRARASSSPEDDVDPTEGAGA